MGVVTVRDLNANVSAAVARLEAGETLTLTKHGRFIADLVPRKASGVPSLAAISENTPLEPGTPEWQAAYDRMTKLLDRGHWWGGKAAYEERTE